jgi:hypothetical protein
MTAVDRFRRRRAQTVPVPGRTSRKDAFPAADRDRVRPSGLVACRAASIDWRDDDNACLGMSEYFDATCGECLRIGVFCGMDGGMSRRHGAASSFRARTHPRSSAWAGVAHRASPHGRLLRHVDGHVQGPQRFPGRESRGRQGERVLLGRGFTVRLDNRFGLHFEGIGTHGRGRRSFETEDIKYRKMTGTFDTDADTPAPSRASAGTSRSPAPTGRRTWT